MSEVIFEHYLVLGNKYYNQLIPKVNQILIIPFKEKQYKLAQVDRHHDSQLQHLV